MSCHGKDHIVKIRNAVIKKDIDLITKALCQIEGIRYLVEVASGSWVSMLAEDLEFVDKQDQFLYYINFERPFKK